MVGTSLENATSNGAIEFEMRINEERIHFNDTFDDGEGDCECCRQAPLE